MEKLAIFREYDIRGIYNQDLTEENVIKIGFLIGEELKKRGAKRLGLVMMQECIQKSSSSGFVAELKQVESSLTI